MSIKYGELTIIYKNQITFTPFWEWLNSSYPTKEDQYIFLFDDEEICDYDDKINEDIKFDFCNNFLSVMPLYFENKINKKCYFYKKLIYDKNDDYLLDFN